MAMRLGDIKAYKDSFNFEGGLEQFDALPEEEKSKPAARRLQAEFYYQDKSQNTKERFEKALEILDSIEKDDKVDETNRLRGAIYKRKYPYSKDVNDIYRAIHYYCKALQTDNQIKADAGYGAGNVLYLYHLLMTERGEAISDQEKKEIKKRADSLAKISLKALKAKGDKAHWDYASMATLEMALGHDTQAKEALEKYIEERKSVDYDREYSITLTQFIRLCRLVQVNDGQCHRILEPFRKLIKDRVANVIESVKIGKKGLALSGGGFRASLFHLGILLSLAHQDKLRSIEVISTVSGGSIVGMGYYLMVKKLLETREDHELTKDDYIDLVEKLIENFTRAIQENIRMKAFDKPIGTSLTVHLGELYERVIYNKLVDSLPDNMANIAIEPKGITTFNPHFHNELRANKVPRIILNATLLNNGHNWQFSQEGMGEKRYMVHQDTDRNAPRLFRRYDAIGADVTIAEAVAASSAVPAIFDPIEITGFDATCETLRLSDGGVYDNLGLAAILQDECDSVIISDGSRQLDDDLEPSNFRLDVLKRSNDILMHTIRDAEYQRVQSLSERGVISTLSIYHLRKSVSDQSFAQLLDSCSKIRTDLDSFSTTEAEALIYCGFRLSYPDFATSTKPKMIDGFHGDYQTCRHDVLEALEGDSHGVLKTILLAVPSSIALLFLYFYPGISVFFVVLSYGLYTMNKPLLKNIVNKSIGWVMRYFSRFCLKYTRYAC